MAVKFSATYLKMSTDKYKLSWLELNFIWIGSNINGNFFKLVGKQVDLNWGRPGSGLTRWINCSSCKVNEVVQLSYFLGLWSWSWEAMYPFFCSTFACLYYKPTLWHPYLPCETSCTCAGAHWWSRSLSATSACIPACRVAHANPVFVKRRPPQFGDAIAVPKLYGKYLIFPLLLKMILESLHSTSIPQSIVRFTDHLLLNHNIVLHSRQRVTT